ncbi:MAG: hypothetical protein WBA07_15910 [Rivularia sp. (in: cyanobacteria)]
MNIHTNTQIFLENSLKIGSAIFLIVGASLVIPKIADAAWTSDRRVPNYAVPAVQDNSDGYGGGYQPPNFGSPSSAYGSGTR